jgi:predicted phosphodiesterase
MYKYEHFIPENIAPIGAKRIGVYNSTGKRVCGIPLGNLAPPTASKLYSFLGISDVHIELNENKYKTAEADFRRALEYAENNCDFTCICGDLTSTGSQSELSKYKNIVVGSATKPVYAMAGNHETSSKYVTDDTIKPYTGYPLYYTVSNEPTNEDKRNYYNATVGNDVFIMLGYYGMYQEGNDGWRSDEFLSVAELQWLYETLEANRNKRCFVFVHPFPKEHGVGNANNLYTTALIWKTTDGGIGRALINLLRHYKNTVVFHGHSHLRFWLQELDKKANYSNANGYRSVHISSLAVPRDVVNGSVSQITEESEGYIVDVYDDYIILNGRDFVDNEADGHILPIATYKIDTTLQTVEANTFTDNTGTITT